METRLPGGPLTEKEQEDRDQTLIIRTLTGDREAYGALIRKYERQLYRLLRGIVRNHADADDLTQEAFYRALRYLDRFDLERPFQPWLFKIGVNLALQHLRSTRRGQMISLDDGDPETGLTVLDRLEAPGAAEAVGEPLRDRRLAEAVEQLPPLHRSILILRAVEGLHYEEIAGLLGIPIGTVMSRLNRARSALRQILGRPGDSPNREQEIASRRKS